METDLIVFSSQLPYLNEHRKTKSGKTSSQFHQHFTSSFYTEIRLPKKLQSQTVCK